MFFEKYYISAEHVIGEGTFSICLQVTSKETKKEFAAKIMKLSHDAKQEIAALEACQGHPNIVELIETVQDEQFQYIVFELLSGGELLTHISECYFLTAA
jgi:serine/threonine protein kinase